MSSTITSLLLLLLPWSFCCASSPVLTRHNSIDGITIGPDRRDWESLVSFEKDSVGEPGIGKFDVDWIQVTIANSTDRSTLFVRYEVKNSVDFTTFPAFYNLYIDADKDRTTGYVGTSNLLPIGADFLIQGGNRFSFSAPEQTTFEWTFEGAVISVDNSYENTDITFSFLRVDIGNPDDFHFVLMGDNALNGHAEDYYPDAGNQGASGEYFRYSTGAGPSASYVLVWGSLIVWRWRKRITFIKGSTP